MPEPGDYLHGFTTAEQRRLYQQAHFLEPFIYPHLDLSKVSHLLEVGCGVGAQSEILLRRWPSLKLTGIDISREQVDAASTHLASFPAFEGRYHIEQANAAEANFGGDKLFDGAFFCWLLEHALEPLEILCQTRDSLKPGGSIFLTEVFNHTFFSYPLLPQTREYWVAYNKLQESLGGDPEIGAKLGYLLSHAGFEQIKITPRPFYWDRRFPLEKKAMFNYWTQLLLSASDQLIARELIGPEVSEGMQIEMESASVQDDSIFFYSFVQAEAVAPG